MNCQPYMSWRGMNSKQACKQHLHQQHNSPNLGRMRTSESSLHLLLTMSRMPSHCSLQSRPCVIYMDTMGIQDYNQREPNTVRLANSIYSFNVQDIGMYSEQQQHGTPLTRYRETKIFMEKKVWSINSVSGPFFRHFLD
jgi:hypothetical protein